MPHMHMHDTMFMANFWEKRPHFSSAVLEIFPKILRRLNFENAVRGRALKNLENDVWERRAFLRGCRSLRTPVLEGKARSPLGGLASFFSLLLLISHKLHAFWPMLWRQYLSYCSSFHFHTMQLIRDGQSCSSVQKTLASAAQSMMTFAFRSICYLVHIRPLRQDNMTITVFKSQTCFINTYDGNCKTVPLSQV